MRDFFLTTCQRDGLEQQLRETADAGVFRRTLAVLEAARGRPVAEIARLLRTSRPSVYEWLDAYRAAPAPGSLVDHRGGNHPTLRTKELRALLAASLAQPPDRWGYAAVEWTIPLRQEQLARYGGSGLPPTPCAPNCTSRSMPGSDRAACSPRTPSERKKRYIRAEIRCLGSRWVKRFEDETDLLLFPPLRAA